MNSLTTKPLKKSFITLMAAALLLILVSMSAYAADYAVTTIPVANAVVRDGDVVNMATVAGIPGNVLDTLKSAIGNATEAKLRINFAGLTPDVLSWADANLVQNSTSIWAVNSTGHDLTITSIDVMVPVNAVTVITPSAAASTAATTTTAVTTTPLTTVASSTDSVAVQSAYITDNPKTGNIDGSDITPVVGAIISLLGAIITAVIIPLIRSKTTAAQWATIKQWTATAVQAAEVLYNSGGQGEEKRDYVMQYVEAVCKSHGFKIDTDTIRNALEQAWTTLPKAEAVSA